MWLRLLFSPILLLALAQSHAGKIPESTRTLYRCSEPGKAVSYQSSPCQGSQRLQRVYAFQPEPDAPPSYQYSTRQPRYADDYVAHRRYTRYRQSAHIQTSGDRCRIAKQTRADTLERVGLRRTYDLLSQLDANVREACR